VAEDFQKGIGANVLVVGMQRLDYRAAGNLARSVTAHAVGDRERPTA
jgi:hypothetical protein